MKYITRSKYIISTLCCACAIFVSSCRSAAFNAAIQGDAVTMQRLVNEGACLKEKNAMDIPKNPLYKLLVQFPVGLTAMAWDIGTMFTFFTGFSLAERVCMKDPNDWDDTPINAACLRGHAAVVRIMLRAGERPDNFTIHQTVRKNYVAVVREFLEAGIIGPNWKYNDWPLLMWSARAEAPNVTHLLISRGAFVNYADSEGRTPLFLAAWNSNVQDARYLIAAGANILPVLNKAHDNADADKCIEIVNTLVKAGAPKSAFASHYLYGRNDSTLAIAISNAGAEAPQPAPKVTTPNRKVNKIINKPRKRKSTPARKDVPKPAPKPKKSSNSSILQDFA